MDEEGRPLSGASVRLTILEAQDADWEPAFQDDDWGPLARTTLEAASDEEGEFEVGVSEELAGRSFCVWATRPGYLSALSEGAVYAGQPALRLVLARKPGGVARVLDGDGVPVAGAQVVQFGLVPGATSATETALRARRHWEVSAITDERGEVELACFDGEQVILARREPFESLPWRGRDPDELELRLAATFTLTGSVELPDWSHLDYEGERRVTVSAMAGNVERRLRTLRGVEAGAFGPLQIPIDPEASGIRVRIEGSPVIPQEVYLDPPEPGEPQHVALSPGLGHQLWILARDMETKDTVLSTEARVEWRARPPARERGFVERRSQLDGYLNLWSFPDGSVAYTVRSEGYVPYRSAPLTLPLEVVETQLIELVRGAPVSGRVVQEGRPVTEFEVAFWLNNLEEQSVATSFTDEDGRFTLEAVPIGHLWLTASSGRSMALAPQSVQVSNAGLEGVVIELQPIRRGRGRVVDAGTLEPIENARVQPHVQGVAYRLHPWGRPLVTDADGYFEGPGFVPGVNRISVDAPGYRTTACKVDLVGTSEDLGDLEIGRPGRLEVHLLGDSRPPAGVNGCVFKGLDSLLEPRTFGAEGVLVYDDVAPGTYRTAWVRPNGDTETWVTTLVAGEDPWILKRSLVSDRAAVVDIQGEDKALERLYGALLVEQTELGRVTRIRPFPAPPTEPLLFEGVEAPQVQAMLAEGPESYVGSANASFGAQDEVWMTIDLGEEPVRIRVTDVEGTPLREVALHVVSSEDPGLYLFGKTSGAGEALIHGVPRQSVLISARHETHGTLVGVPFDGNERQLSLVLEDRSAFRVEVRDGLEPVAGARVGLVFRQGRVLEGWRTTDVEGRASYDGLTPRSYQVRFSKDGHWTTFCELSAVLEPEPQRVQLPRVADLVLTARTAEGTLVSGARIELIFEPSGERLSEWIEKDRLEVESTETDELGTLTLQGIPHGTYSWSATAGASRREGRLEVARTGTTRWSLSLP